SVNSIHKRRQRQSRRRLFLAPTLIAIAIAERCCRSRPPSARRLAGKVLVPRRDPRISESSHFPLPFLKGTFAQINVGKSRSISSRSMSPKRHAWPERGHFYRNFSIRDASGTCPRPNAFTLHRGTPWPAFSHERMGELLSAVSTRSPGTGGAGNEPVDQGRARKSSVGVVGTG